MATSSDITLKQFITSLPDKLRINVGEQLGAALDHVNSTHGAVFVFDGKTFVGLCSPYQALYKSRLPYSTKVENCIVNPPKLTVNSTIFEVAEAMSTLRIYTLPVFNKDEEVIGVVHVRTLLSKLLKDQAWLTELALRIQPSPAKTTTANALIKDVYEQMRNGSNRIVIVNETGRTEGIVTRSDVKHVFLYPSDKQRFSGKNGNPIKYSFDPPEKISWTEETIQPYITPRVIRAPHDTKAEELLDLLLKGKKNSLVLVDDDNIPTGIISTRTVLKAITFLKPEASINVEFTRPSSSVPEEDVEKAYNVIYTFGQKMSERFDLDMIKVNFEEPKYQTQRTAEFQANIQVIPIRGEKLIATGRQKKFLRSIHDALEQIEKQQEKNNL